MSAIVVSELTKKFRRQLVFNNFNLEVFDGEIFSVMGLSGSGKTTLARILFNFYKPNKGSVTVFDMSAQKEAKSVKEFTSYIPEDVWIYDNLKPIALFKHTLAFHGLKNTDDIQSLMEYFELDNKHKFIDLTDSERKRVAIVNALITKPKLLIIDNPTKDLNHAMMDKLFTHLKRLQRSEGLSVLLLTDDLSVGQRFGDRGAYISGGRLVGLEYLKEKKNNDKVLRIFDELVSVPAFESIGCELIKDESGDIQFFYDGYLPTLTTVLHQEKIKNFTLEDALLENKINSFEYGDGSKKMASVPTVDEEADKTMDNDDTILAYDEKLIEDHKEADDELTNDSVDEAGEGNEDVSSEPSDEEFHDASLAEDRDATIVMDREIIEAADGVEQKNPVDPYNSDELIHDSRKTAPITAVDDDALAEEQLKSEAGKEEE
ncbi:ABC transporter ATP-binding protein [Aedoeadaptatus coxii]|uniref:ABC transporter ATP-binding protein n=1 Tax=Aedoeadaptatus coxii TaxID=755172 RepID=UPI002AD44B4D|nr:ABC transporter ATP-binding protein [Peptoniphilus coxii]